MDWYQDSPQSATTRDHYSTQTGPSDQGKVFSPYDTSLSSQEVSISESGSGSDSSSQTTDSTAFLQMREDLYDLTDRVKKLEETVLSIKNNQEKILQLLQKQQSQQYQHQYQSTQHYQQQTTPQHYQQQTAPQHYQQQTAPQQYQQQTTPQHYQQQTAPQHYQQQITPQHYQQQSAPQHYQQQTAPQHYQQQTAPQNYQQQMATQNYQSQATQQNYQYQSVSQQHLNTSYSEDLPVPLPLPTKKANKALPTSEIKEKLCSVSDVLKMYPMLKEESKAPTLALKLAYESFFGTAVMRRCTPMGVRDLPALPQVELYAIKCEIFKLFPQYHHSPYEFESLWTQCLASIGQACKRLRH